MHKVKNKVFLLTEKKSTPYTMAECHYNIYIYIYIYIYKESYKRKKKEKTKS